MNERFSLRHGGTCKGSSLFFESVTLPTTHNLKIHYPLLEQYIREVES